MSVYDRILLTGAGGMLARALRQGLETRGLRYVAVTRGDFDVADASQVESTFDEHRPTLVLNCAAYTKVDLAEQERERAEQVNGDGPAHLAAACRACGAKLVHFSTDYVFDGTLRRPLRPDDLVGPRSAYGKSKLLGEQATGRVQGLDHLIVRTAWLYGPGGPNFVRTMASAARAGKPLRVVNDQIGAPTYTIDLAAATLELIEHGAEGIWHLTNSGATTWFDFARAIFETWNLSPDLQPIMSDTWKAQRPESAVRPAYSVLDVTPFEQLTGHAMRHWSDALSAFKQEVDRTGDF